MFNLALIFEIYQFSQIYLLSLYMKLNFCNETLKHNLGLFGGTFNLDYFFNKIKNLYTLKII